MPDQRGPGQRAGLTHEAVRAAARDVLAEGGLDSLTMRSLARRLGVAPNALYSHVANKAALVDDLLDDLLAEVEEPPADIEDPVAGLHRLLTSTYEVLTAHEDLVPLYVARQGARGPNARRLGDTMIALLARQGFEGPRAREALRVLVVYCIGFAAFATHPPVEAGAVGPLTPEEMRANFANGLRWLLTGIHASGEG